MARLDNYETARIQILSRNKIVHFWRETEGQNHGTSYIFLFPSPNFSWLYCPKTHNHYVMDPSSNAMGINLLAKD